jgi:polar amino acid transport system substrate-binding protein
VLYTKDSPIESYDDLAGKKVSVARGSTNDTIMTENFPETEVVRFETIADAIAALKAGKVDAAVEGEATVSREAEKDPQLEAIDAPPLKPSIISMGVLPGEQVWLNYLNNFVRNLTSSGTNAELYEKWFDAELPELLPYQAG